MTCPTLREEFETWLRSWTSDERPTLWDAWQASRAALVVELPDPIEVHDSGDYQMDTIDALEAAGIRVKP